MARNFKIRSGSIFRRFSKGSSLTDKRLTDQSVVLLMKNIKSSRD